MKIKKTKKSVKQRGNNTYGHGARKKWKGSGHRGGFGMAGTGKRADHKKSLILKKYGNKYFGKQGITSRSTKRKKDQVINLRDIEKNIDSLTRKYEKQGILDLSKYKILGEGGLKSKLKIKALSFTKSAKEKIEKAGGEVILAKEKKKESEKKPDKKKNENKGKEQKKISNNKKEKSTENENKVGKINEKPKTINESK